jgi:hypothetical protein
MAASKGGLLMAHMSIRQDGTRVLILMNDKLVASMPWDAALHVAAAIKAKALQAEEIAKAAQIAKDQAIVTRAGMPFGLTSHPKIQREAMKIAQFDREIRRSNLPSIGDQGVVGTPALVQEVVRPQAQVIRPGGIESEEQLGNIGG